MRKLSAVLSGFLIALGSLVMMSNPAAAHHDMVDVEISLPGDCGETTFTTVWPLDATHEVANTKLVVQFNNEQIVADIGESIDIGPFDEEDVTIRWRVWGGGERNYDDPALTAEGLAELIAYIEAGGSPLDMDAPGVAWHELPVKGCVPTPTPNATASASPGPTPSATPSPSESAVQPTPTQSSIDKQAVSGNLPMTGSTPLVLAGAGVGLAALGVLLFLLGRRRRSPTTS